MWHLRDNGLDRQLMPFVSGRTLQRGCRLQRGATA